MEEDEIKEFNEDPTDFFYFREKVKKHWILTTLAVVSCIIAFAFGIVVFWNTIDSTVITDWGITHIQELSTGRLFYACLWVMLREFLFVVLPTISFLGFMGVIYWFVVISEEEQVELKLKCKSMEKKEKKKRNDTFGGISGCVSIAMMIIIALNGNWLVTFENLSLSYFLNVWLTAIVYSSLIIGIPVGIISFLVFFFYKKNK